MAAVFQSRQASSAARAEYLTTSDAELVAAAQKNPLAFSPLYHRYVEQVYRFCFIRLGDQYMAEDATSETFLKALGNIGSVRGTFSAWLFRIAHNVVVDVYRQKRPVQGLELTDHVAASDQSPEEQVVARNEADRLRKVLSRLPEDQRIVIELDLAGWTGAQISEALGKRAGSVRMIRYRARQSLKLLLDPSDKQNREQTDV